MNKKTYYLAIERIRDCKSIKDLNKVIKTDLEKESKNQPITGKNSYE